jgi:hypothetical protein
MSRLKILGDLPIGARLVLRCRKDWREAVVSRFDDEKAVLTVGSPSGKTYRVRRPIGSVLQFDGEIPFLNENCDEIEWRENLVKYDLRW